MIQNIPIKNIALQSVRKAINKMWMKKSYPKRLKKDVGLPFYNILLFEN